MITQEQQALIEEANRYEFPAWAPVDESREAFNRRFIHITGVSLVIDTHKNTQHSLAAFEKEVYRHAMCGSTEGKQMKAATAWLSWEKRARLDNLTYEPGKDKVYRDKWNTWEASGVLPVEGDIQPWSDLLDHLFIGKPPAERKYFEQWCAYPLKHLGSKLHVCTVLYGGEGIGKGLLSGTLQLLYGSHNSTRITNVELRSDFNGWEKGVQFVVADEIERFGFDRHGQMAKIKNLVTGETSNVNEKGVKAYTLPNRLNLLITSNSPDALPIGEQGRRFFVVGSNAPALDMNDSDGLGPRFLKWRKEDHSAGLSALLFHFQNLDMTGFNPWAPAPSTESARDLRENTSAPHVNWLREFKADPGDFPDLASADEIRSECVKNLPEVESIPSTVFSKALPSVGFSKASQNQIRTRNGKRVLYIVQNGEAYKQMSDAEKGRAYDEVHPDTVPYLPREWSIK